MGEGGAGGAAGRGVGAGCAAPSWRGQALSVGGQWGGSRWGPLNTPEDGLLHGGTLRRAGGRGPRGDAEELELEEGTV